MFIDLLGFKHDPAAGAGYNFNASRRHNRFPPIVIGHMHISAQRLSSRLLPHHKPSSVFIILPNAKMESADYDMCREDHYLVLPMASSRPCIVMYIGAMYAHGVLPR